MKDITTILQNFKVKLIDFLPKILLSIAILIITYLIARLIKFLIIKLFHYIEKGLKERFNITGAKQAGVFVGIVCFWLIIFSGLLIMTDVLGLQILKDWLNGVMHYLPNVIAAIIIIFAAIFLSNLLANFITSFTKESGFEYSSTLSKVAKFIILFMAAIIALDQLGIEIALLIDIIDIGLAALLFGAALAFGLGAKTSISNILATFYIRKSYKEGDEIQIGEIRGRIIKIDTTNVVIDHESGKVTVPADQFSKSASFLITKK